MSFSIRNLSVMSIVLPMSLLITACDNTKSEGPDEEPQFKVVEYLPAPGQFINEHRDCNTMAEAVVWAQERMEKGYYVSLGAFGGYVTVKIKEPLLNLAGHDFGVIGNAFEGSSEAGIVWVAKDVNANGVADENEWYELGGSASGGDIVRGYELTYTRPAVAGDIPWHYSGAGADSSGVIKYLGNFHSQMYYPKWVAEGSYSLKGTLLMPKTVWYEAPEGDPLGDRWVNGEYEWGYADNYGSDAQYEGNFYKYNKFDISNAVDAHGNAVQLDKIDFIKVQSAILCNVESLGEVSTEVCGFIKL